MPLKILFRNIFQPMLNNEKVNYNELFLMHYLN